MAIDSNMLTYLLECLGGPNSSPATSWRPLALRFSQSGLPTAGLTASSSSYRNALEQSGPASSSSSKAKVEYASRNSSDTFLGMEEIGSSISSQLGPGTMIPCMGRSAWARSGTGGRAARFCETSARSARGTSLNHKSHTNGTLTTADMRPQEPTRRARNRDRIPTCANEGRCAPTLEMRPTLSTTVL